MTQWGLDTLFNPSKRHMDEEKRRLQSTREEVGDSSGGKRIDLESGKVKIPKNDGEAAADDAADGAKSEPAMSPSRARAAARRKALRAKSTASARTADQARRDETDVSVPSGGGPSSAGPSSAAETVAPAEQPSVPSED
jgi:hypothetical protein